MKLLFIIATLILSGCTERTDPSRIPSVRKYVLDRLLYVEDNKGNCLAVLDERKSTSITLVPKENCK